MIEIKKLGKGHEVYKDGILLFWVIGTKANAKKELEIYLKNN